MPLVAHSYAAPSHLGVVIRGIVETIGQIGDATPVMVGAHYASVNARGVGSAPHIILVPEPDGGACEIGAAYENARAAGQVHACDVIVRAAEPGGDIDRLDAAYELSDFVVATVRRMCAGKVEFGKPIGKYPSPTTSDAFGAGLSWSFTYDRDIPLSDAVYSVPGSDPDDTPARPYGVPGDTGTLSTIGGTTAAQE